MSEHDEVAARYAAGKTTYELAAECEVDATTIRRWLLQSGIAPRRTGPRERADVSTAALIRLRDEDFSLAEIALLATMSKTGVRRRLLRAAGVRRSEMDHSTPSV